MPKVNLSDRQRFELYVATTGTVVPATMAEQRLLAAAWSGFKLDDLQTKIEAMPAIDPLTQQPYMVTSAVFSADVAELEVDEAAARTMLGFLSLERLAPDKRPAARTSMQWLAIADEIQRALGAPP